MFQVNKQSPTTILIAISIWLLAILLSLPDVVTSILLELPVQTGEVIYICYPFPEWLPQWYKKVNILGKALIFYVIPLSIIATYYLLMARSLYSASNDAPGELQGIQRQLKTRKKVAKIVLWFVGIFAVCFLPNHIFLVWFYFDPNSHINYNDFWHALRPVGFTLSFVNSCVNPIALYCISGMFRGYYNKYLCSYVCCCCKDCIKERTQLRSSSLNRQSVCEQSHCRSMRQQRDSIMMTTLLTEHNGQTEIIKN